MTEPDITVRKADLGDFDFFYAIKSEPSNLLWTGHKDRPDYQRLKQWYCWQLDGGGHAIYIIEAARTQTGYLYVDTIKPDLFELAIGVSETHSGKGIGSKALREIVSQYQKNNPRAKFVAWIREDNLASMKAFTHADFKPAAKRLRRWIASVDKAIDMVKYIRDNEGEP